MKNLFKVNNKDTRTTSMTSFWLSLLLTLSRLHTLFPAGKFWSEGRPPPTSPGRPLKILFDSPGDVPIWRPGDFPIWRPGDVLKCRPGDVLIWRSRNVPGSLIRDIPRTFSGRPLEDLESTQTWMSIFFKHFFQNLFDWPNLKASQYSRCIENPVKLLI